ncbi:acetoin utilization protein AcuC [Aquisalibacillus elongatus]|uniref:Acetoin utilization protein AcuC n=1 Tax=Aquisalibacillus elongatus TaxID=485577 RepID=A0A3N5CDV8_9BACI|nr:acetoin utilization protein AcuC [Aquisalibacillus elongatus]RPF55331.1 acetoin utilization protein AcuC [Aquisalibacillus elongatus]
MTNQATFIYSQDFQKYKFRENHPFNQKRVELTYDLLKSSGLLNDEDIIKPRMATDDEILSVHHPSYVDAIKRASYNGLSDAEASEYGIGTEDTPIFANMHEASAWLVGGTLTAVEEVINGQNQHAVNLGGGLHHGFTRKASGFCIYNDAAIAIKHIREHTDYKVLYVDTDAHHGDGVQWIFYDDPNVCTLSIHETGRYLFPGTGNVNERGRMEGYGYSFNVPVDAFSEDESFLEVYQDVLKDVAEYFKPDIIVTQNGADAHVYDPLTHLCSTMKTFEEIPKLAHEIAHQYCEGRWIALGGGGYDIWRVVPRAWAQIWNVASDQGIKEGALPEEWLQTWQNESPVTLPTTWQDPPGIYKNIPRKQEITEKNRLSLQKSVQFITNQQKYM